MYEQREKPLLPRRQFIRRVTRHGVVAGLALLVSLVLGVVGFHWLARQSWLDAFLNASMLLGGMGPVHTPETAGGKLFAGCYALYCGLVFLVTVGVLLAPVLHRALHKFHWTKDAAK